MTDDPSASRTEDTPRRRAGLSKGVWTAIGVLFAWVLGNAVWQKQLSGYLAAFAAMYVVMGVVFALGAFRGWLRRHWTWFGALAVLAGWLVAAGSYSIARDLVLIALAAILAALLWPEGRRGLAALRGGAPPLAAPPGDAPPVPARIALTWLLVSWVAVSATDAIVERRGIEAPGTPLAAVESRPEWRDLRIGVALSGGGYRAALVHAGVLDMLGRLGVRVSALGTVSGGSILGAYLARGGTPQAFRDAVAEGRFRMRRDLTWIHHALRLPAPLVLPWLEVDVWPFGEFSRLDVQSRLLDRVLLHGASLADAPADGAPRLLLAATDLRHGLALGMMDSGLLLLGPTNSDAVRQAQLRERPPESLPAIYFDRSVGELPEPLRQLSMAAAVSGAFPGAFPALRTSLRLQPHPRTRDGDAALVLPVSLSDGGVVDNLGVNLLQAAAVMARIPAGDRPRGHVPDAGWRLDVIIASDGGKTLEAARADSTLSAVMRAIDLSGTATGALRPLAADGLVPVVLLSALSTVALTPDDAALAQRPASRVRSEAADVIAPERRSPQVLEQLASVLPPQMEGDALLRAYREHARGRTFDRAALERCPAAGDAGECAWAAFVAAIRDDLELALQAFLSTPTLEDRFTRERADRVYRFGQYLALLQFEALRVRIEAAAQASAAGR